MVSCWVAVVLLAVSWRTASACMCSPRDLHPQTQYCNNDFVIVGRVQKLLKNGQGMHTYKVKIRNTFKATEKAKVALRSGFIYTPAFDSLCGRTLQPRETYVISGRITHLEAHITICDYVSKWREVTPRQRKGFRLLYKQGCTCKVHTYMNPNSRRKSSRNTCVATYQDCHERHGICLHDRTGRCKWTRAPALTRCLQPQRFNSTMTT